MCLLSHTNLINGTTFECFFGSESDYGGECYFSDVNQKEDPTFEDIIMQIPEQNSIHDVKYLRFLGNSHLYRVPHHIFTVFPKLQYLYLNYVGLEYLDMYSFHNARSLEVLSLNGNRIRHLTMEIFRPLENLRELLLWNNPIESVDPNIFNYMPHLFRFDLSKAVCINEDLIVRPENYKYMTMKLEKCYENYFSRINERYGG